MKYETRYAGLSIGAKILVLTPVVNEKFEFENWKIIDSVTVLFQTDSIFLTNTGPIYLVPTSI